MTTQKLLLFAAVTVLSAVLVRTAFFPVLDLVQVVNRTVCPIVVDEDVDMNRVPQRIKVLQCSREPDNRCKAQNLPLYECCQASKGKHSLSCVEMRDTVLVYYKDTNRNGTVDVAVGCSCMIEESIEVPKLPDYPLE